MEVLTLEQSDYYKTCIFRTRINKKLFFEALPNLFSLKEALVVGEKFHMKSRTVSKVLSASMPYLITQPAYGLYEKIQVYSDGKIIKSYKIPETSKIKKSETMREIKFYTVEEKNIMKKMLSTGQSKRVISRKLAIQFNRSEYGIYQLLGKMRSFAPKVEPVRSLATIRAKKVLQDKKQEEALQEPAEIGVEVPHGMTFEGKPKKIMLHSDHFRIYF
jgi:hypothetical protein